MLYDLLFFFCFFFFFTYSMTKNTSFQKQKKKKENRHIDDLQCCSYCVPTRGSPTRCTSVIEKLLLENHIPRDGGGERSVNCKSITSAPFFFFRNKICILTNILPPIPNYYFIIIQHIHMCMHDSLSLSHTHTDVK